MQLPLIEGPGWTGFGVVESPGRYPLRVEGAVSSIVGRLLPGVITTTRHARMYALHTLGWAEATRRGLGLGEARELIRRLEVAIAAVHHVHSPHHTRLSAAHGEGAIPSYVHNGVFALHRAAEPSQLSVNGFAGVYQGPCVSVGALTDERYPRPGERADIAAVRAGLGDLIELADTPEVTRGELRSHAHLCLCEASDSADGRWLAGVLVESPETRRDARRQRTCALLFDTLAETPSRRPEVAFRDRMAYGRPTGEDRSERYVHAEMWRAAALRNFSVAAWRSLWRWLTRQLLAAMTLDELAERLADELPDITVASLLADLPDGKNPDGTLAPAELEILAEEETPLRDLRMLAVGARRLGELKDPARGWFIGEDRGDLGPAWFAGLLDANRGYGLPRLGRELAATLVRRAQRVALSKMEMRAGRPYVPTRLRERDGVLWVRDMESAGDVALRMDSLTEVLAGLGYLRRGSDDLWRLEQPAEKLRARLA
jgi:hypothetical protein